MGLPPFHAVGRTFVSGDRVKMLSPAVTPATTGAGIISLIRATADRPAMLGFSNSGGAGAWRIGRQATTSLLQIRNAAGAEAAHSSYQIPLNVPVVVMAYSAGDTEHYLAAGSAATLEKSTTSVTLETVNALHIGTSDNTSPIGNHTGQAFWIGALKALPPLDLLDQVLRQVLPPTVLLPWLAHLIPLRGSPKEYCVVTRRELTVDVGAPRSTVGAPQPQIIEDEPAIGRLINRYRLVVSYGD
ncbi:MAG: hypothetical protein WAS21_06795, partial [Geminicoccaceae bacterium]